MIKAFFRDRGWALWAYGGGTVLLSLIYIGVHYSVIFNQWYQLFYDLLQNIGDNTIAKFYILIRAFLFIAIPWVLVDVIRNYVARLYAFKWREAITLNYLPRWVKITQDIEGASQRIQDDAFRFSRLLENFGLKLADAVFTLFAFIPILAGLSRGITLGGRPISLVLVVLVTSLGGTLVSFIVGKRLTGLEYSNQKVEAAFRKELVYGEDDKVGASLPSLLDHFVGVRKNYYKLYKNMAAYDTWAHLFNQAMVVVPYILAAPGLFKGIITLGIVFRIADAFGNVQGAFNLIINNFTEVTEFRSIVQRLGEFEKNLSKHETK